MWQIRDLCQRHPQYCGAEIAWGALEKHINTHCPATALAFAHEGCRSEPLQHAQAALHVEACEHKLAELECGCTMKNGRERMKGDVTMQKLAVVVLEV